eukprot:TRINITY_DN70297_c0_g1_i1.p2 TRINITY_DN70297_c0_g1~~TRINITY_DN70297_c0_g1_i1.p2  ORF type:complete len:103 (+),score=27.10 TRINITY_DN70297_c0_g1_i1:144-452(+)
MCIRDSQTIKKYYPGFETSTFEENSNKFIKVAMTEGMSKAKRKKLNMEKREKLPEKPFLHFDMMKVNTDTMGAVFTLTKYTCLLYTSPSPRDLSTSRMPSSA